MTAPVIQRGNPAQTQQAIQFAISVLLEKRRRADDKAATLIDATVRPGTTVGQLTPEQRKAYERIGLKLDRLTPEFVIRPHTRESMVLTAIEQMPSQRRTEIVNRFVLTEAGGGPITDKALADITAGGAAEAAAGKAGAETRRGVLEAGRQRTTEQLATPEGRAALGAQGQQIALGGTAEAAAAGQAGAAASISDAQVQMIRNQLVGQSLRRIQNSPEMNAVLKEFGLPDVQAAVGAAVTGIAGLFDSAAQMRLRADLSKQEARNLLLEAKIRVAQDVSNRSNGVIDPEEVLAYWQGNVETDPEKQTPREALLTEFITQGYRAYVTEAALKGDPNMIAVQRFLDLARAVGRDEEMLGPLTQAFGILHGRAFPGNEFPILKDKGWLKDFIGASAGVELGGRDVGDFSAGGGVPDPLSGLMTPSPSDATAAITNPGQATDLMRMLLGIQGALMAVPGLDTLLQRPRQ